MTNLLKTLSRPMQKASLLWPLLTLGLILLATLFAPFLAPYDPSQINPSARLQGVSWAYPLGTDTAGRDILSRILWGARASIAVGLICALVVSLAALIVGVLSGYFRCIDVVTMRILDGLMAIPPILLAIGLMTVMGSGLVTVVFAISVAELPRAARLVRAVTLSTRNQTYVLASMTMGSSHLQNIRRNIVPATLNALIVHGTFLSGSAMLTESVLSFIGAGLPPTVPTWGNIMADGRALWQFKFGLVLYPAVALCLTVLCLNMIGDAARALLDPKKIQ